MSMSVSEAVESARDVAAKLRAIGLPVWADVLVDSIAVLRAHIEREVDEAMVDRACAAFRHSGQATFRDDMKAALIAALEGK